MQGPLIAQDRYFEYLILVAALAIGCPASGIAKAIQKYNRTDIISSGSSRDRDRVWHSQLQQQYFNLPRDRYKKHSSVAGEARCTALKGVGVIIISAIISSVCFESHREEILCTFSLPAWIIVSPIVGYIALARTDLIREYFKKLDDVADPPSA